MSLSHSKIAQSEHCAYCFDMLLEGLINIPTNYDWSTLPLGHTKMPVFVTWYKRSLRKKYDELRGCLGTFCQELPIRIGLKKYAIMSAINDKRFDPIPVKEIPFLKCSISLLHSFTRAKAWDDWELGKHGITIQFSDESQEKQYNATYLPEVPGQQRWNKLTTLENLVSKAGYDGLASTVKNLTVTKYQSCKYVMTWQEYLQFIETKSVLCQRIALLQSVTDEQVFNMIVSTNPYNKNNANVLELKLDKNDMAQNIDASDDNLSDNADDNESNHKNGKKNGNHILFRTKFKTSNNSKSSHSLYRNHSKNKILTKSKTPPKSTSKFRLSATKRFLRFGSKATKLSTSPPPFSPPRIAQNKPTKSLTSSSNSTPSPKAEHALNLINKNKVSSLILTHHSSPKKSTKTIDLFSTHPQYYHKFTVQSPSPPPSHLSHNNHNDDDDEEEDIDETDDGNEDDVDLNVNGDEEDEHIQDDDIESDLEDKPKQMTSLSMKYLLNNNGNHTKDKHYHYHNHNNNNTTIVSPKFYVISRLNDNHQSSPKYSDQEQSDNDNENDDNEKENHNEYENVNKIEKNKYPSSSSSSLLSHASISRTSNSEEEEDDQQQNHGNNAEANLLTNRDSRSSIEIPTDPQSDDEHIIKHKKKQKLFIDSNGNSNNNNNNNVMVKTIAKPIQIDQSETHTKSISCESGAELESDDNESNNNKNVKYMHGNMNDMNRSSDDEDVEHYEYQSKNYKLPITTTMTLERHLQMSFDEDIDHKNGYSDEEEEEEEEDEEELDNDIATDVNELNENEDEYNEFLLYKHL